MTYNARRWIMGLANAFVSGAAASAGTVMADPDHFNMTSMGGVKHMAVVAALSGLVSLWKYIAQHPLTDLVGPDSSDKPKQP